MNTLVINIVLSTFTFYFGYRWLLAPAIPKLDPVKVLQAVLLLHSFRQLGLMFLTQGVTSPELPQQFAVPAATGDFISAALAALSAGLLARKSTLAIPALWVFTVVGCLDFVMAVVLSRIFRAGDFLGGAYWIPAFWVPMLAVGHLVIFDMLRQIKRGAVRLP
jgi:hypothetical protein